MIGPVLLAVTLLTAAPGKPVKDEFQYLFSRYDTDGLAPASNPGEGDFSGHGDSFDPGGLPSGGNYPDRGMTVESPRFGSIGFLRPRTDAAGASSDSLRERDRERDREREREQKERVRV